MKISNYDVVVVGSGIAGLASAISAKDSGADVLIIEHEPELGGSLRYNIQEGLGQKIYNKDFTGPELIQKFIDEAIEKGIEYKLQTEIIDIKDNFKLIISNSKGLEQINARSIIIATGSGYKCIPEEIKKYQDKIINLFTTDYIHRMINLYGISPGKEVIIYGSDDQSFMLAKRLTIEGTLVKAVISSDSEPLGTIRTKVECLDDYDIPLELETNIENLAVKDGTNILRLGCSPGRETSCDALIYAPEKISNQTIFEKFGLRFEDHPVLNDLFETSIKGLFVCGHACYNFHSWDDIILQSIKTGKNAALFSQDKVRRVNLNLRLIHSEEIDSTTPEILTGTNNIDIYIKPRINAINKDLGCYIDNRLVSKKHLKAVRPQEIIHLKISKSWFYPGSSLELRFIGRK